MSKSRKSRDRSEPTRHRILSAAIRIFSKHGMAGARIGTIATAARVNKALLYYYFRDKEALYAAALEDVADKVAESALAVLDLDCSPGERMLRFTLQHFDRILCQQGFQALMQQEMVRVREGRSAALHILAKTAFEPIFLRAKLIAQEGIRTGELCDVDWMQMMYSALGANVFYFLSAPMVRLLAPIDPLEPAAIAARRSAAIGFLGHAIFIDRKRGARLAKKVLATMPIPEGISPGRKTA
jgi:TetR/AcrR family transcriptional regulator